MTSLRNTFAGATLLALLLGLSLANAAGANNGAGSCSGGSVVSGTYTNLVISGYCTLDAGSVTVTKNLTIAPGAFLDATFTGSNFTVDGNLAVQANAAAFLGCEPEFFDCSSGGTSSDVIWGNLDAQSALGLVVHATTIHGNATLNGGGGGLNCDSLWGDLEDNTIWGQLSVTGFTGCWLGVLRNTVHKTVTFNYNSNADPDGNEVATNTIYGDLNCLGNSPAPQIGDSGGSSNTVYGKKTGQCVGL